MLLIRSNIIVVMICFSISLMASCAHQFLAGWRYPTKNEMETHPFQWREDIPERYLYILADFNGDGNVDEARLLINDER